MPEQRGWQRCPTCPPEDNLWPPSAFAAFEIVRRRGFRVTPICNACVFERYPRTFRACAGCGGLMDRERGISGSGRRCHRCSRGGVRACERCGEPIAGAEIGGRHVGCYLASTHSSKVELLAHA